MFPGIYKGKITGRHHQAPLKLCMAVIPQVSGTSTQTVQLPSGTSNIPEIGLDVWIAYEGGDVSAPMVIAGLSLAIPTPMGRAHTGSGDGTKWTYGLVDPPPSGVPDSNIGDFYLNMVTGDVFVAG